MFIDDGNLYKKAAKQKKSNKSAKANQAADIESRINDLLRIMSVQSEHPDDRINASVQQALHTSLAFLQTQIDAKRHFEAFASATTHTQRYHHRLHELKKLGHDINALCMQIEQQEQSLDNETLFDQQSSHLENRLQQIRQVIQNPQASNPDDEPVHHAEIHETATNYDHNTVDEDTVNNNSVEQTASRTEDTSHPTLDISMLGDFRVSQNGEPLIKWNNAKAKLVFKYMVMNRKRPISKEILMDTFWPDISPQAARNNLNVTLYYLRKNLPKPEPGFSHILFKDDRYYFNPAIHFLVDVETFRQHIHQALKLEIDGKTTLAMQEYKDAEALYRGEFLANDPYEEWASSPRNDYNDKYILALNKLSQYYSEHKNYEQCISTSRKILEIDSCDEAIHLRLIQCYYNTGQRHLAIRQYKTYETVLRNEMGLSPSKKATELLASLMQ